MSVDECWTHSGIPHTIYRATILLVHNDNMYACKSTWKHFLNFVIILFIQKTASIMLSQGLVAIDSSFQTKKATKGVSSNWLCKCVYCCHNCPKTHYASFHRKLLSSLSQYVHTTIFVQDKVIVHSILCKRSSQN